MFFSFFIAAFISCGSFAETYFNKLVIDDSFTTFISSLELSAPNKKIKHLIITVSGSERNAETYANTMVNRTVSLGVNHTTLVIAPYFKIEADSPALNELMYSYEGWWIGDDAINGSKTSSFKVMDELILKLSTSDLLPNLKSIVLTGHSAGGHLVQRYALGSSLELKEKDIKLKYVVANPGTYAYLNAKRPMDLTRESSSFKVPANPACAFNRYKYGLESLNSYMSQTEQTKMIERYLQRDVVYFIGENDTGDVEQTCEAQYQGINRFVRGLNFTAYLNNEFQSHEHQLVLVRGVGHTQTGMYNSTESLDAIFSDILN